MWTDRNSDLMYALVSYSNDTPTTFDARVTVECIALDKADKPISKAQKSFFAFERGAIAPGFKGTLELAMDLHGLKGNSASCQVVTAQ